MKANLIRWNKAKRKHKIQENKEFGNDEKSIIILANLIIIAIAIAVFLVGIIRLF